MNLPDYDDDTLLSHETRLKALQTVHQELWRRGNLRYKFHQTQLKIAEALERNRRRKFFLLCSRRLGKSYMLVTLCFQTAIRKPGSRILFLAPYAKDAADIANDLAVQILADCPDELKPDYNSTTKEFVFRKDGPNASKSIVRLKGVNGEHARQLRGGATDLIVLDECAQMDNLDRVVSDVCMPMTMTTGGSILLATTPPDTPGHPSFGIYMDLAASDSAVKFTVRDAPHVSEDTKIEYLLEAGEDPKRVMGILDGSLEPETTTAQREYFCEFVTDSSKAVLPEFSASVEKELTKEVERPPYFDCYVSMDPGFEDRTGILFAYWDFVNARLVIEDEVLLHRAHTPDIAEAVKKKEEGLWNGKRPYIRVSDVDKRLAADLYALHGLTWHMAHKEDSLGAINLLRNDIHCRKILIHPRCVHLRRQMRNAIWNTRATDFQRPAERTIDGHFDLVAALKYLTRTVQRDRNPYPTNWWAVGGPAGPPSGSWISPKASHRPGSAAKNRLGLLPDTPIGRKLSRRRR